ncbi:hypothetical protein AZK12_05965 [Streptococcus pneumoniae]|nr:hypothetical protein AZK12_05965 [Streptococcus pneumoniae]
MESIIKNKKIVAINNGINVSNSDLDVVGVQDFKKNFVFQITKKSFVMLEGWIQKKGRIDSLNLQKNYF